MNKAKFCGKPIYIISQGEVALRRQESTARLFSFCHNQDKSHASTTQTNKAVTNTTSHTFVPPTLPLGTGMEREHSWLVELSALSPLLIGWRINNQIKKLSASEEDQLMSLASSPSKHVFSLSLNVASCDFLLTEEQFVSLIWVRKLWWEFMHSYTDVIIYLVIHIYYQHITWTFHFSTLKV